MPLPGRETRWLVVAEDGRHGTLGRHSDPTDEEVARCGAGLDQLGLAGWLVVSEGQYYSRQPVGLLMVRLISRRDGQWAEAEQRWHALRAAALPVA